MVRARKDSRMLLLFRVVSWFSLLALGVGLVVLGPELLSGARAVAGSGADSGALQAGQSAADRGAGSELDAQEAQGFWVKRLAHWLPSGSVKLGEFHTSDATEAAAAAEVQADAESSDIAKSQGGADASDLPPLPQDFERRSEGFLTLYYPSGSERIADQLFDEARGAQSELRAFFGQPVLERVEVRLARSVPQMMSLTPVQSRPPEYASGLAYSARGLIYLSEQPRYANERYQLTQIFRHELAHVALHDAVGQANVPRWFNEGLAVVVSGESQVERIRSLFTGVVSGSLFSFAELNQRFPSNSTRAELAYAQSAEFLRFLRKPGEEHRFYSLIERLERGQPFEVALADAYASNLATLEADFRAQLQQRYSIWPVLFGGSLVWVAAIGLIVLAYFKRKKRAQLKLEFWRQQERLEDAREAFLENQRQLEALVAKIRASTFLGGQQRQADAALRQRTSPQVIVADEVAESRRAHQTEEEVEVLSAEASERADALLQAEEDGKSATPCQWIDQAGDRHTLH